MNVIGSGEGCRYEEKQLLDGGSLCIALTSKEAGFTFGFFLLAERSREKERGSEIIEHIQR